MHSRKEKLEEETDVGNTYISCAVCRLDIPVGASKCTHCSSYQNWRKYLSFSSNILALLIALVSVCTMAYTAYSNLSVTKDSEFLQLANMRVIS